MAKRGGRRSSARRRRNNQWKAAAVSAGVLLLLLTAFWSLIWPYLLGAAGISGAGALGWWLWRTDRLLRSGDRKWRAEELVRAGHRTLADVDKMTGTEFEELVADLCRRDGCSDVQRVGGAYDNGADVLGRLPDGRKMVIQCKRYAPTASIPSREVRDLLGARQHFKADVAIFVATTRFTSPAETFAQENGIIAIHRDHFGVWNNGATLESLTQVSGAGQGDTRHRALWKKTYQANGR